MARNRPNYDPDLTSFALKRILGLIRPGKRLPGLIIVFLTMLSASARSAEVDSSGMSAVKAYSGYHALVVGVSRYAHWQDRPNGVPDARDISWELTRIGVSVELLTDPAAPQLQQAWQRFILESKNEENQGMIVYYSGHSKDIGGEAGIKSPWLIPKDAPLLEKDRKGCLRKSITLQEILSAVKGMDAKSLLFLFDTPLPQAEGFLARTPILKLVTDKSLRPVHQFITSADRGETLTASPYFKRFLLKGLRGEADLIADGLLSGCELGLYLTDRLSKISEGRQHPRFGYIAADAALQGDFILKLTDRPHQTARLFVEAHPLDAKIQIVNIIPKFKQGIELPPGEYHLHVSAPQHQIVEKKIRLAAGDDRKIDIRLPRNKNEITNSIGMNFVRLKAGEFMMGSPTEEPGRAGDEGLHNVRLTRPFFMQDREVSVGQFKAFVTASSYATDAEKSGGCWITEKGNRWAQQSRATWKTPGATQVEDRSPVICVSWNDAEQFARWLSRKENKTYRLPTEAEWEYAARAGTATPFFTGDCLPRSAANYGRAGSKYRGCNITPPKNDLKLLAAGSLTPNPWQLYNMLGNLSEWCRDWYGHYPRVAVFDPQGAESGNERVMRGGHWQAEQAGCRAANRRRFPPTIASDVVGFRLVLIP